MHSTIKFASARLPAALAAAAIMLAIAASSHASAKALSEVFLASPKQALKFCKSGNLPAGDIAYISGTGGVAQYGSSANCVQQVPTVPVNKALEVTGTKVSECKMAGATAALKFCNSGEMGEYNIDYIAGKVGKTVSGPGYGCIINYSTSGIGTALCK